MVHNHIYLTDLTIFKIKKHFTKLFLLGLNVDQFRNFVSSHLKNSF